MCREVQNREVSGFLKEENVCLGINGYSPPDLFCL